MKSMTGYGRKTYKSSDFELDVNLRSVNGRFFELRLHLPKELIFMEGKIKKEIAKYLNRGTLDLYVQRKSYHLGQQELVVETKLAKSWMNAFKKLSKELNLPFDLNLKDMALLPGVSHIHEKFEVSTREQKFLLSTVASATQMCLMERKREGLSIKKELFQLITKLKSLQKEMSSLRDKANLELQNRYKEKFKKWLQFDENRIAMEISHLIDKADINEEISRLSEHLKGCSELLDSKEPVGKKLDFYSQEILREINTIGSKSQVSRLTEAVVDAKSIIERFREQVQNIE